MKKNLFVIASIVYSTTTLAYVIQNDSNDSYQYASPIHPTTIGSIPPHSSVELDGANFIAKGDWYYKVDAKNAHYYIYGDRAFSKAVNTLVGARIYSENIPKGFSSLSSANNYDPSDDVFYINERTMSAVWRENGIYIGMGTVPMSFPGDIISGEINNLLQREFSNNN